MSLVLCVTVASLAADAIRLPADTDGWNLPLEAAVGRPPVELGTVEVRGKGTLAFDPAAIETTRPDVFRSRHFSVFDVLVYLAQTDQIELEYTFDEVLGTHVIQSLNGLEGWWYDAHYEGGSFDRTVARMDLFPVKDGTSIVVYLEDTARLDAIHEHFREEVGRRAESGDSIVIPTVTLRSAIDTVVFENVSVSAHDVRSDVFQPGSITMLDVLLSLGEQGALSDLTVEWRAEDEGIAVVDGYYVVSLTAGDFAPEATGACVLTHQIGGTTIVDYLAPHTHTMSHVHLTADLELLVSPEAVEWLWVCL